MSAITADDKQSRTYIAQTPSVPLGTLEEPPEVPPLPEALPTPATDSPLLTPKPSITPSIAPAVTAKIKVNKVEVSGSTVFSPAELAKAVNSFVGQELSYEQLLEIRIAIDQLYISKGYKTSGAFLYQVGLNTHSIMNIKILHLRLASCPNGLLLPRI